MTDKALGQSVPKLREGLFLMDGIEGLLSLPKHSVDMILTDPPLRHDSELLGCPPAAGAAVGGGALGLKAQRGGPVLCPMPL